MLLNENFVESTNEKSLHLPDKKYDEMVEFFCCMFAYPSAKPISITNFARLIQHLFSNKL